MKQNNSSGVLNAEDIDMMRRLSDQGKFATQSIGEFFAEDASCFHNVLDLGSGSGEWVLSLAQRYSHMRVVGIDINENLITYARMQAENAQLQNATFQRMSAIQPPPGNNFPTVSTFSDVSFDLINGRFFGTYLPKEAWLEVVRQCYRLLRTGGTLQLTDHALASTNSPAFDEWTELNFIAQVKRGQKKSKSESSIITLRSFLEEGRFQVVGLKLYTIEFSFGQDAHKTMSLVLMNEITSNQMLLVERMGLVTAKEYEDLKERVFEEFRSPEFKGVWFLFTLRGRKA